MKWVIFAACIASLQPDGKQPCSIYDTSLHAYMDERYETEDECVAAIPEHISATNALAGAICIKMHVIEEKR